MKNGKFFDNLTVSVASGHSVKEAAKIAGCSLNHAYTLSCKPDFRRRVSELRSAAAEQAVGRLADAASEAVDTLRSLLDPSQEPSVRLQASKAILSLLPSISEHAELRNRLDTLEQRDTATTFTVAAG